MREIRQSGSEGGEITKVIFPTPIQPKATPWVWCWNVHRP